MTVKTLIAMWQHRPGESWPSTDWNVGYARGFELTLRAAWESLQQHQRSCLYSDLSKAGQQELISFLLKWSQNV